MKQTDRLAETSNAPCCYQWSKISQTGRQLPTPLSPLLPNTPCPLSQAINQHPYTNVLWGLQQAVATNSVYSQNTKIMPGIYKLPCYSED